MIIVDNALAERQRAGKPIRVGLVGAGYAGKGFALQLLGNLPGLKLVCISNRTLAEAENAYRMADVNNFKHVTSASQLSDAIKKGEHAVTSDPNVITSCPEVDCVVEATGEIEFASHVAMNAFAHKKHVVVLNAELDATLGPILRVKAKQMGAFFAQADGDQPAVIMNQYRYAKSIGFKGKFAIHPEQLDALNECFSPSPAEIAHAERVVAAFEEAERQGRGSTSLDGWVIDVPVVKRARALLDLARRIREDRDR